MEWINVEDRLPEADGEYHCYLLNNNGTKTEKPQAIIWFSRVFKFCPPFGVHITHWQPLPEPPEETR